MYYRAGYTPDDYPTEKEWEARLLIERSSAIKAPSIAYHLCGTKRVQQVLAEEGVLEQFFPQESEIVGKLRQSFAGMYDLDRKGKYQAQHQAAMEDPAKYVMKPQREGGGTLVVGNAIVEALQKWDDDKLNSHILMERINPVAAPNFLAFGEKLSPVVNVVPEIPASHAPSAHQARAPSARQNHRPRAHGGSAARR